MHERSIVLSRCKITSIDRLSLFRYRRVASRMAAAAASPVADVRV